MVDINTLNWHLDRWAAGTRWRREADEHLPAKLVWDDGVTRVRVSFILDSGVAAIELTELAVGGGVVLDVDCHHEYETVLEVLSMVGEPVPSTFRPIAQALLARFPVYDNDGEQSYPIDANFLAHLPD